MTLLLDAPDGFGASAATARDARTDEWRRVRGSIVALDAADAFAGLLARRIQAELWGAPPDAPAVSSAR